MRVRSAGVGKEERQQDGERQQQHKEQTIRSFSLNFTTPDSAAVQGAAQGTDVGQRCCGAFCVRHRSAWAEHLAAVTSSSARVAWIMLRRFRMHFETKRGDARTLLLLETQRIVLSPLWSLAP